MWAFFSLQWEGFPLQLGEFFFTKKMKDFYLSWVGFPLPLSSTTNLNLFFFWSKSSPRPIAIFSTSLTSFLAPTLFHHISPFKRNLLRSILQLCSTHAQHCSTHQICCGLYCDCLMSFCCARMCWSGRNKKEKKAKGSKKWKEKPMALSMFYCNRRMWFFVFSFVGLGLLVGSFSFSFLFCFYVLWLC